MEDNIIDKTIKALRNSCLSNYRISLDTGISDETISNYRKGKSKPRGANLKILSEYLSKQLSIDNNELNDNHQSLSAESINIIENNRGQIMKETVNDRILLIIEKLFNGNKAKFAKSIEIAPTSISNYLSDKRQSKPSADMLERIINVVDSLSAEWLLTGKGSMLKEEVFNKNEKTEIVSMAREVFEVLKNQSETILSQQRTIETMEKERKKILAPADVGVASAAANG